MATTEGTIGVTEGEGKNLDTVVVEQTDGTDAHREAVVIAGVDNEKRVNPEGFNDGDGLQFALPVTGQALKRLSDHMASLYEETRLTNLYLSRLVGETFTTEDLED